MELTVGMATYRDFDGVYFTIQALRLYQDLEDVEILVVDNFGCETTRDFVEGSAGGRYICAPEPVSTSFPRDLVFREARGNAVLCMDSHVLLAKGVLHRLKLFYREHPDCMDLLQGPLIDDDLDGLSSHFEPIWRDLMWGVWALDPRAQHPEAPPFDIPMQGLGLFSCRKAAWPGFHPGFRGFGGEEGYIHQKFRNLGRRCLCVPWLRWIHRFGRPAGAPYPMRLKDRITNYIIGHRDTGLDESSVLAHFCTHATASELAQAIGDADRVLTHPEGVANQDATVGAIVGARPLISCLCPTFGRCGSPWQYLLEEAIESFLRQTDIYSELVILNDHPEQEIIFDHPRVRIINHGQRFGTLGEKYNALVSYASGELLAPWEDDDISLPYRLERSREHLGDCDYFNPRAYWFQDDDGLHADGAMGVGHNLSLFRRGAWLAVGGYPAITGSQDAKMDCLLTTHPSVRCRVQVEPLFASEWYYIYRWGISPCHLSAQADMQGLYDSLADAPAATGRFRLRPHWRHDYSSMVAAAGARTSHGDSLTGASRDGSGGKGRGCDTTYKRAAAYLAGVGLVEDWGCTGSYFRRFLPPGCYRGVATQPSGDCDRVTDLAEYTSDAAGILVRHVLEHHPRWRRILQNAIASFRRRMVLVVSTPFVRATNGSRETSLSPVQAAGIRFCRTDLIREFGRIPFRLEENVVTDSLFGREHVFYLSKQGPA
jgi:glycosyltransferase involved in cell wall biosynthesis